MEKIKGIQNVVFGIIEMLIGQGQVTVKKSDIKRELMKTSIARLESERYPNDRVSKLDRALDQALFQLKKNLKIKSKTYGEWSLVSEKNQRKYKPKICQALRNEYLVECPKCGAHRKMLSESVPHIVKCENCGRKSTTISFFRHYCPIKATYIGDPTMQCELLHGTEYTSKTKMVTPMRVCYFAEHPNELSVQLAKRKIQLFEENEKKNMRKRYSGF